MNEKATTRQRCAIYTRKSSEEGLEQSFNSLDAQREACVAYIASQKHAGWVLAPGHYDDGGHSGGTLERPALQRLLKDIQAHRIDIIVVYKVDRLTRSLADFAKIVEILDAEGASFVSVTQQFNTTSSMGRLTLNMLLSFAQFEREVTGERIRDKIAASKRKGMWMGGFVPLGYEAKDRTLKIVDREAKTVRSLFSLYQSLGNVRLVKKEADRLGLKTKPRTNGAHHGGAQFSRGHIYKILSSPIYVGRIPHKGETHQGQHPALIDQKPWDQVQAKLAEGATRTKMAWGVRAPSLLAGLLFEASGQRLTPSHAVKSGRRYRYYISKNLTRSQREENPEAMRIPALELEALVIAALRELLFSRPKLAKVLGNQCRSPSALTKAFASAVKAAESLDGSDHARMRELILQIVRRIEMDERQVRIAVDRGELAKALGIEGTHTENPKSAGAMHLITIPAQLKRRGLAKSLIVGDVAIAPRLAKPDPAIMKALQRAHRWWAALKAGEIQGPRQIAKQDGVTRSYVTRILRLAFLAPDITARLLSGQHPPHLTAEHLIKSSRLPLDWGLQRNVLGISSGHAR